MQKTKAYLGLFLSISLCLSPFIGLRADSPTEASKIGYAFVSNMALQAEDYVKVEAKQEKKKEEVKDVRKANFQIRQPNEFEQKEITYGIFEKIPEDAKKSADVMSKQEIQELNILCGDVSTRKANLLSKIKETITVFGESTFALMLARPIVHIPTLKDRQAAIKYFLDNPAARTQVEESLQKVKEAQSLFLSFWIPEDDIHDKVMEQVYFGKWFNKFNNNPYALELLRGWKYFYQGLGFVPPTWGFDIAGIAAFELVKRGEKIKEVEFQRHLGNNVKDAKPLLDLSFFKVIPNGLKKTFRRTWNEHNPNPSIDFSNFTFADEKKFVKAMAVKGTLTSGDYKEFYKRQITNKALITPLTYGMRGVWDLWWAWRVKESLTSISFYNRVSRTIHTRMNAVATVYNAMRDLESIIRQNKESLKGLSKQAALDTLSSHADALGTDFARLTDLLGTDTFKTDSVFSLRGRVLAAYTLMPQVKEHFAAALEALGEIDVYVSMAKLMKKFENKKVHFCFVDFIEGDRPSINLVKAWNPLVNPDQVVTEDVKIGTAGNIPNMMITGPHGCGKSTVMKSIAFCIILAQVFGIAPADQAIIALYDRIITYLNIKENLELGLSTFMAECRRVDEIEHTLKSLKHGELAFVLMDEVFKGTMEEEGAKRLYNFGKVACTIPQSLCIIATHFKKPTDIQEETNGKMVNYFVELLEPQPGEFVRTFKLLEGKNEWWFNDAAKRERFINWLKKV